MRRPALHAFLCTRIPRRSTIHVVRCTPAASVLLVIRTHTHTHTHMHARTRARTHARAHTRTRTRTHTHHTERFPRGFGAGIFPYSGLLITTLGYEPGVTNMATRQQAKILNFRHPPYPPNSKLSLTVQDTLVHDKCFSAQVMFNIVLGEGGAMRTESEVSYFAC